MADVQKTIEILFQGDDRLSSTIRGMSSELDGLATGFNVLGRAGDVIESIAQPFATLAKGVLATEAALGAMAAGGLAYSITKAIEFEAASADLNKVLGEESDRLQEAQDAALAMSSQYGVSSSEVLASMANFKQAGFDLTGAMELTAQSIQLMIAGDLSAAEASDILVASLKGFKAPAEEAGRLTDILNEVSNKYATNVAELGSGMARLSPIASQMGFSFEETAGILTPVIEVFRSGDEAANALKTGLLKLVDDSAPVQNALASIGVSQRDANGELRSGKDILFDVATAFTTLDDNQKIFLASQLVGIHQAGRMVEVFDGLNKTTEVTDAALGAAGSAANEVAIRLETAEVAVKRFAVGFENLGIEIGKEFLMATTDIVQGGTDIENTLRTLVKDGTFDPVFEKIRSFGVEFGELLDGIAAAMPEAFAQVEWEDLLASLENLKGSFGGLFDALFDDLDLTKPDDLAAAIQKVVDGVTTLTNITSGIIDRLSPLVRLFVDWAETIGHWDAESQKAAGNRLADALIIEKFGGIFGSVLIALTGDAKNVHEAMSQLDIMGDPFATFTGGAEDAAVAISEVPDNIIDFNRALESAEGKQAEFKQSVDAGAVSLDDYSLKLYRLGESLKDLPAEQVVDLSVQTDDDGFKETMNFIEYVKDGVTIREYIELDADSLKSATDEIEEKLPSEKQMEVQAKLDIEKLKIQAEVVQAAIEWEAKLDIAKVESDMKKFVALVDSATVGIESTAEVLGGLFGMYMEADAFEAGNIESWIRKEYELREQEFKLQERLTETQIGYMKARTNALAGGQALITISGDGLEPELEAFMWAVLSRIQIRATQEGADFLVGI